MRRLQATTDARERRAAGEPPGETR
jgi:hypothetical protein